MKILATFKSVPDPDSITSAGVPAADARWIINPFDSIAIEEALRIKERGESSEVVCVTIGPARVEDQARTAFAMGADRVMRVDDDRALDPYAVSRLLKAVVEREQPNLVLMGKQAVDDDCNQAGQMLAGLLDWPQATFVSRIEFRDGRQRANCTRETDAGLEVISVRLPAVITVDLRLNEPRYVSLPGLIKARGKQIETLSADQLGMDVRPLTTLLEISPPPKRRPGTRLESVAELVAKLHEEAKVL